MGREYFEETNWMEAEYAGEYRAHADNYVLGRRMQLFILQSFYRYFMRDREPFHLLDLGCGDGELAAQIKAIAPHAQLTLVDGSAEMLAAAQARFADEPDVTIQQATFAELIANSDALQQYDMIVSGFAIHHLYLAEKVALFKTIFRHLQPGGAFVNIDTVLPSTNKTLTDWYYKCWEEWIVARQAQLGLTKDYRDVPQDARYKPENKLSTLPAQLESLKSVGFVDVGCHYQNSIFVVFSGMKKA